ncbi:MAG: GNAT family N-acetyltransferase [Planctomycetota bacterium]|nr:MAG: GNAT family N-acetyltransferase [Planctomycetota bacterium]
MKAQSLPDGLLPLSAEHEALFFRFHQQLACADWCYCVAWWVPDWTGWGERSADQNRSLRQSLFAEGIFDGYFWIENGEPVAWCQVAPRGSWPKLMRQFELQEEPGGWALGCFLIPPAQRGRGLARVLLKGVLADLRRRGVAFVEAFPKQSADLAEEDLWNGPLSLFLELGFEKLKEVGDRAVLRLRLDSTCS